MRSLFSIAVVFIGFCFVSCEDMKEEHVPPQLMEEQKMEVEYAKSANSITVPSGPTRFAENGAVSLEADNSYATFSWSSQSQQQQQSKMIIKNANVECRVNNFDEASIAIHKAIAAAGGTVASENEIADNWNRRGTIVVRIDNRKFDTLIAGLCSLAASVQSKSITANDVSEEYHDNETRLRTKYATEQQYLAILKQAKSVEDILNVNQKLGEIREEIESMEGRQNYLRNQVAYSTITFNYTQQLPNAAYTEDSFLSRVRDSLSGGWHGLQNTALGIIGSWNVVLVLCILYLVYRLFFRKRMAQRFANLLGMAKRKNAADVKHDGTSEHNWNNSEEKI